MTTGRRRLVMVATTGRSDYGLVRPVIRALLATPRVRVRLLVTGTHLSRAFGDTKREIVADGFGSLMDLVDMRLHDDDPLAVASAMGRATGGVARLLARRRPDIVVLLGDRFETLAVAAAALPFTIPIAHIHGGERTEGAIDEVIRHALTKMSHLHFVSSRGHASRVAQMGEPRWRIVVSGAPGLDDVRDFAPTPPSQLAERLGVSVDRRTLLVTFHPETLRPHAAAHDVGEMLSALDRIGAPVIFTAPNADMGRTHVHQAIASAVRGRPDRVIVPSLGHQHYFSLLASVGAMVGNSSSGLIEAPSFRLPVVNIGDRQRGRERAGNVIDVTARARSIERAIRRALSPAFRRSLRRLRNPYAAGGAGAIIARALAAIPIDRRLLVKTFVDRRS